MITPFLKLKNRLSNPFMNIDSNSNGIADGWTTVSTAGGTFSIEEACQRIYSASSTGIDRMSVYQDVTLVQGQFLTCRVDALFTGVGCNAQLRLSFRNASNVTLGTDTTIQITNSDFTTYSTKLVVAPENTAYVRFVLEVYNLNVGDSYDAKFKNTFAAATRI